MSHLTDTVKRLEKEKDVQAAEIKNMKGFAKHFFPNLCYSKVFLSWDGAGYLSKFLR